MRQRIGRADPALLAIVGEGFLSRLSFGLVSFALPLYALQLGMSLTQVGLLTSVNMMVGLAFKPVGGWVADRFGLKPSLSAAIGLRSVVSLLLAMAGTPWQLFSARSVHGLSIALRDPAVNALLADCGGKKAVASSFAWYQTAKSLAGALGKAAAGVLLTLTARDFSLLFVVAFALSALPIYVVARYVPRREGSGSATVAEPASSAAVTADRPPPTVQPTTRRSGPARLPFIGLGFLVSATAYMLANLFPILATEYAGLSEAQTGAIYLISPLLVLSGPLFGWLSDHIGRKPVLLVRSVANTLSSVVFLVSPDFAGMAAGRALDDVGKAAFRPAWGSLMAHVASFDPRRRAQTMSLLSMGDDAGEIIGPILAGFLWSTWGVAVLLTVRVVLALATEVYALVVARSLPKPGQESSEATVDASTATG